MELDKISTIDLVKLGGVIIREIRRRNSFTSEMVSYYDKQLSTLYHTIGFSNFSASKGYKYYSRLKNLLQLRRIAKNEWGVVVSANTNQMKGAIDLDKVEKYFNYLNNYCEQKEFTRSDEHNLYNYQDAVELFEQKYNFSKEVD